MTVFFTTDDAGFDFEDHVDFGQALEVLLADGEVFFEVEFGAVEHVAVEEGQFAGGDALFADGDEGVHEWNQVFGMAVVGVQGDQDVVALCKGVGSFGEHLGAEGHVFDAAGGVGAAAAGNLDDAVAASFGKAFHDTVNGFEAGDVDGWVCKLALLGVVKHLAVLVIGCNWHRDFLAG